jgi:hypothetical protein
MSTKKYLCPKHQENTPSAAVYGDGYFCFGCGARGPVTELGLEPGERIETTYVEDIQATLDYIGTLPTKEIRGFKLPYNERGYFLVYPCRTFYKFRVEGAEKGDKYRVPSGHGKPAFVVQKGVSGSLTLVEGEFNALSLGLLELNTDLVSPGGAGDFYSRRGNKDLRSYGAYLRINLVVDADAAGALAAIETKSRLITLGCPDVRIHLVEKDFNDILVEQGKEALRDEVKRMGLL